MLYDPPRTLGNRNTLHGKRLARLRIEPRSSNGNIMTQQASLRRSAAAESTPGIESRVSAAREFFPTIDALRAIAAFSVVIFHVIGYNQWTGFYNYPGFLLRQGWLGVDLFFVISGFVISISLFTLFDGGQNYRSKFLIKRAVRICPLHYITCAAFVIVIAPHLIFQSGFAIDVARYATFFYNFDFKHSGLINAPNWSLAVEVQFYILIAFIIPFLRKANPWLVFASGLIVAAAWRSACYWALKDSPDKAFAMFFYTTQLPGMIDSFAMGFVVARIMTDSDYETLRNWCSRNLLLFGALAVVAYGAAHYIFSRIPPSYDDWRIGFRLYILISHHVLTASAFTFLVLVSCFLNGSLWLKISAPVRYLGVISYGIYLWHVIVILALKKFPDLSPANRLILTLGFTIVLASASWHLIEKPLSRRVRANTVHTSDRQTTWA